MSFQELPPPIIDYLAECGLSLKYRLEYQIEASEFRTRSGYQVFDDYEVMLREVQKYEKGAAGKCTLKVTSFIEFGKTEFEFEGNLLRCIGGVNHEAKVPDIGSIYRHPVYPDPTGVPPFPVSEIPGDWMSTFMSTFTVRHITYIKRQIYVPSLRDGVWFYVVEGMSDDDFLLTVQREFSGDLK